MNVHFKISNSHFKYTFTAKCIQCYLRFYFFWLFKFFIPNQVIVANLIKVKDPLMEGKWNGIKCTIRTQIHAYFVISVCCAHSKILNPCWNQNCHQRHNFLLKNALRINWPKIIFYLHFGFEMCYPRRIYPSQTTARTKQK